VDDATSIALGGAWLPSAIPYGFLAPTKGRSSVFVTGLLRPLRARRARPHGQGAEVVSRWIVVMGAMVILAGCVAAATPAVTPTPYPVLRGKGRWPEA